MSLHDEIARRRTFAIISHPDAGKTTLTEKLLLYGGAIHLAGEVKARRAAKSATSDWMAIERERGISVTSAAMQFAWEGFLLNLLDTPGHQDFSEDTYRTICAADSAIMLIDAAKGVEPQTEKLFQVCRLREMPIFTFINKMDRDGRDPFDLMDEIEKLLGIHCVAANWPIGRGREFAGIHDIASATAHLFERAESRGLRTESAQFRAGDDSWRSRVDAQTYKEFRDSLDLVAHAGEQFNFARMRAGEITPVFFGSALNGFGVEPFLERFAALAPPPTARMTTGGMREPDDPEFSGFIFKIQANMDPNHRDRMAFLRIVSGRFERGMEALHVRAERKVRLANAITFFAAERTRVDEAFAGDIVGLYDPGMFRIGDTLTEKSSIRFEGIPRFVPERFARVRTPNPLKRKHLQKGLNQLAEEGALQVLRHPELGEQESVLAAVGQLQLEVAKYRLDAEYGVEIGLEPLPFAAARWVDGGAGFDAAVFNRTGISAVYHDAHARPIVLFRDDWTLKHAIRTNDKVRFLQMAPDVE